MTTYDSDLRRSPALDEVHDLAQNASVLRAFVARDVKIRYRRSILGAAWSLASPLLMMIVLTLAFSHVFATHAPAFPAFVLPGLLLWNFFALTTTTITAEAASGYDLWRRARVPKTAQAISTTVGGLLHLAVALVPLIAFELILRRPFTWALLTLPIAILLTGIFVLGFGLLCASIALYAPDVGHLYQVISSAWMFITPVIYPMSILPERMQRWIAWNPMTWFVSAFRDPLYLGTSASIRTFALMFAASTLTLAAGWILYTRHAREAAHRG